MIVFINSLSCIHEKVDYFLLLCPIGKNFNKYSKIQSLFVLIEYILTLIININKTLIVVAFLNTYFYRDKLAHISTI